RLDVAHVDPLSFVNYLSGGNQKFPVGIPVNLRAISGHRDTYFTECPGAALYVQIPAIAHAVASTGLPKLYSPAVEGQPGGLVRFSARLSSALPWTTTVVDQNGQTVATGSGTGTEIDWSWDASEVPPGTYSWTISSPKARVASGTLIAKTTTVLALQNISALPQVISP